MAWSLSRHSGESRNLAAVSVLKEIPAYAGMTIFLESMQIDKL
jgi:hypothetical protein